MDQKQIPLVEALTKHQQTQPLSFHVPGHKNGTLISAGNLAWDVTELTGLDDLHAPESCIQQAELLLSDFYQTIESKFLINGSTVGNLVMILSTISEGDTVFVQRNCHKSVLNALKIVKAVPVFLTPEFDEETKTASFFSKKTLLAAYKQYKNVKAVIMTYPTYYGKACSIEDLISTVKKHGSLVLVDEAHGAHLAIKHKMIPPSTLSMGADLVVQSAHKMLPAMTMGAYLHIQTASINRARLFFYLQALQSSSPSYPIMASLDYARAYLASYTEKDVQASLDFKQTVMNVLKDKGFACVEVEDPYKLLVRGKGLTGYEVQQLFEAANIYIEMADALQVLLVFPLLKKGDKVFAASFFQKANKLLMPKTENSLFVPASFQTERVSALVLSYNELNHYEEKAISLRKAEGEISAEMIVPYPPGIPLLLEGEEITAEHIETIEWLLDHGSRFHGGEQLKDREIIVFRKEQ